MDPIASLVDACIRHRPVSILYRKPKEENPTPRIVEAYQFLASAQGDMLIQCYQVEPEPDGQGWRSFRADRLLSASDTGRPFQPRRQITIADGELLRIESPVRLTKIEKYIKSLRDTLLDGVITDEEAFRSHQASQGFKPEQIRFAHCAIYRDVLAEVLLDGDVDEAEVEYLRLVRVFLDSLGFNP